MINLVAGAILLIALCFPFGKNLGNPFANLQRVCDELTTGDFNEKAPDVCVRGDSTLHK